MTVNFWLPIESRLFSQGFFIFFLRKCRLWYCIFTFRAVLTYSNFDLGTQFFLLDIGESVARAVFACTKNTSQYPWRWEKIKDSESPIGARFFDAGEICKLRLHTVTCLPSLWRKTAPNKQQAAWPWIDPRLHTKKLKRQQVQVST